MLNHVIPILVLCQFVDRREYLVLDASGLVLTALLEYPLDDPASVGVCTHLKHTLTYRVDDELHLVRGKLLDALLNNVIPVLIIDAIDRLVPKLEDQ